jgi:hypothetical protein
MAFPPAAGVNFQRLRSYLQDALLHQKDKRIALAIALRLDRNQWRAIAQFDVVGDDHDQVDLNSLSYRVEVETSDGWAPLCTVHWTPARAGVGRRRGGLGGSAAPAPGGHLPGRPQRPRPPRRTLAIQCIAPRSTISSISTV